MAERKRLENPVVNVSDESVENARSNYLSFETTRRLLELQQRVATSGIPQGDRESSGKLKALHQNFDKQFAANDEALIRAYEEYRMILCRKLNIYPCKRTPEAMLPYEKQPSRGFQLYSHVETGVPTCALVDETFTAFLGVRTSDVSLFDQVEILPDVPTANRVRVKADGQNESSTITATWGLEITNEFLTDHCKLEIGGSVGVTGLVSTSSGGHVQIRPSTWLGIFRLPGVVLEDVNPAVNPVDYSYFSDNISPNVLMDSTAGLHAIAAVSGGLDAAFLNNGLFLTAPGASFSIVEPNFLLQGGDKIIVTLLFDVEAVSSYVAFHYNGVGTMWMRPYLMHYKWI